MAENDVEENNVCNYIYMLLKLQAKNFEKLEKKDTKNTVLR